MRSCKLWFVMVLIVVLLFGIAGAWAQDNSWLKRWDGVKLVLSSHTGPTTEAYKVLCKDFEQLTGAKVVVIDESWTDLLSKHLAAFAAHTAAYDVLTWPYIWFGHYVEGKMVENLNDWFAKEELLDPNYGMDDFIPAILEAYGRYRVGAYKDSDALWSVPYKFDVYLAQYRTDMFEEAGIVDAEGKAKAPETWEELIEDAQKLQAAFPDMKPIIFPLSVDDPMVATFVPVLASYNGIKPCPLYDENLYPMFTTKEALQAIDVLKKLLPYMPPDALNFDYEKVNAQMAQGKAAYALNWNAYLPVLLDPEKSVITDKVAFALTPGGPKGRPQGLGGWQMGISIDSKNKEAAFQLLEFLTGKDRAVKLALVGGSVARFSVAENEEVVKAFPYYPLLVEALSDVAMRGVDRTWTEVQRVVAVAVNKILLGENAEKTLKETASKVFDIAKKAGYNPEKSGPRP